MVRWGHSNRGGVLGFRERKSLLNKLLTNQSSGQQSTGQGLVCSEDIENLPLLFKVPHLYGFEFRIASWVGLADGMQKVQLNLNLRGKIDMLSVNMA